MANKTATVAPGQALADLAIQYCGSLAALPDLAALNGLALTDIIAPGQVLILPDQVDKRVVAYFKSGGYYPAAGEVPNYRDGIGFWIIQSDFIVQA